MKNQVDISIGDEKTLTSALWIARRFKPGDAILGRYVVESELGQGGMGVVYQCLDSVGGVKVAVKGLPPDVAHNAGEMEDIRANFRLVCDLRHPNIAGVRTLEKDERGDYYLVMDLAHGDDLDKWMRNNKKADLNARLSIIRQIASALDYAHSRKVLHRDIKPGNVMVSPSGRVQLLDFGLAAQISSSLSRTSRLVVSQSGTPSYMSPEQWQGRPQGSASDQYALAVVAYKLLSGRLPFEGDNVLALCHAVLEEKTPAIKGQSSHVNKAILKALAKDSHSRFPSCTAFVDALEGKSPVGGSWRPLVGVLLFVGLALAVAGAWFYHDELNRLIKPPVVPPPPTNTPPQTVSSPQTSTPPPAVSNDFPVSKPRQTSMVERVIGELGGAKATEPTPPPKPQPSPKPPPPPKPKPQPKVETPKVEAPKIDAELVRLTNALAVAVAERESVYGKAKEFRDSPRGFKAQLDEIDNVWNSKTDGGGKQSRLEASAALSAVSNEVAKMSKVIALMDQSRKIRDGAVEKEEEFRNFLNGVNKEDADLFKRAVRNAKWTAVTKAAERARGLIDGGTFNEAVEGYGKAKKGAEAIVNDEKAARTKEENDAEEARKKKAFLDRLKIEGFILDRDANKHEPGTTKSINLSLGERIDMVWCPPGWFMMGSPESELERKSDERRHAVRISKGFWIGKYEITKGQWDAVVGGGGVFGKRWPKSEVNWDDCQMFLRRLKRATNGAVSARLPTEAEWEYACRAGTSTPFSFGTQLNGRQAACNRAAPYGTTENGPVSLRWGVSDVGSFAAYQNAWGVNDMHGNVYEWCQDYYDDYSSDDGIAVDPRVDSPTREHVSAGMGTRRTARVIRGGAWNHDPTQCRSACRNCSGASTRGAIVDVTGFRICCDDLP